MSRAIGLAFFVALAVTALIPSAGQAASEGSRWCADYPDDAGGSNCGFHTYEQCMLNVSGIGGFCRLNPFFPGNERPAAARKKRAN